MEAVFGDKLILSFPDGFHLMDDAEKRNLHFFNDNSGECMIDPERHMLISIGFRSLGGIPAILLSANDIAKNTEKTIRKMMIENNYQLSRFTSGIVGKEKAGGFCYCYESQGIEMYGESYVVKHGRDCFYLNLYARKELLTDSLDTWGKILSSAKWM